MGRSNNTSSTSDPSDNKHEQKLQAVLLADTFSNSFHPITFEPYGSDDASENINNNNNVKGKERPLVLCPLNNVPLLHHTIDFLQGSGVEELFLLASSGVDALEGYIRKFAGGNKNANSSTTGEHQDGAKTSYHKSESSGGGSAKIVWSSKLTITMLRFTDCTNAGDALRELDRRNVIKSDPFILMQGDVVSNVDLREAMEGHAQRRKKDNAAIMTILLQEVGGWGLDEDDEDDDNATDKEEEADSTTMDNPNSPNDSSSRPSNKRKVHSRNHQLPPLRSSTDDLLLALDKSHHNRILLWDSNPSRSISSIPTIFFNDNTSNIALTRNYLDVGIDICSPDVLARFSDEFDYRQLRSQFVANCVAEEEIGLQSRIFGHMLARGEYAGRMGDMRRYHRVSMDLLRRWCYPLVPDNYGHQSYEHHPAEASYVVERHLVYRDVGVGRSGSSSGRSRSHVGRSTQLLGPLLLGPNNSIGERCTLQRAVLGPNCTVMDGCSVVDSHLWGNVVVEEGARLNGVIVCEGAIVRAGALVERGCVIGRGCIVGEKVHLKEFTRITCAAEVEDDDDYSGFDDSSSSSEEDESSSSSDGNSSDDDDEGSEGSYEKVTSSTAKAVVGSSALDTMADRSTIDAITNHAVVGKDGVGRVYIPSPPDDYDSDDDEEEAQAAALELMKSQSIGYDMALTYQKWKKMQMEEEDDGFSLDGINSDSDDEMATSDDDWTNDADRAADNMNHLDDEGMQITGRQKGVDVVKELRDICLEHEISSPVENLRIELNSFKFSQNATYADCCKGAMMAVMEKLLEEVPSPSPGKLVASLKKSLGYWGTLFQSICMGSEEEKAIIHSLESMALGTNNNGATAAVLGKEPAFRFVLQTLHDQEIVNEQAIFEWASDRKEEGKDSPMGALFWQKPTQDFLEWLEEDSSSESGSGSDDDDDDEDSD
mmetsp:Transcript_9934/g.17404  ORF Transcript_9934/g.17404 Transcript_9934/m.17404 type:complete len:937 (+) Transcript_9934:57-2867(+)|eukprot:CAMPEP_0183709004 /NCGR_PEP_ID=MMETSP0737-20130205/5144_1 /TAXON_ID=385413 /ORGANISM="Thalassiosira miniscula, Strain CCMP1093" /LENGTH=936 /DNA_ID=CAMNT_0025936993 /DNA_START=61 /DNA_END=2871 /DNA_ORIENTATION=+